MDVVRKIHTNIDVGYVDHKPSFTKTNTAVSDSLVYILRQIIGHNRMVDFAKMYIFIESLKKILSWFLSLDNLVDQRTDII